jgi:hypothetical protein
MPACAAILLACMQAALAQPAVPSRTVDKGTQSNIDGPLQAVARSDAEWTALWKKHNFDRPAPSVDFSTDIIVAVFMGSRPTAGFAVEIVSVATRDGGLVARYRETAPPRGTVTAQVLTAPYHIVAVPASAGAVVTFEKVS